MLPSLKNTERQYRQADQKLYNPPREMSQQKNKRQIGRESSKNSGKMKIGGGFKLYNANEESTKADALRVNQYVTQQNKTLNYAYHKKSSTDLNQEIKLIEKKIKQCQRKIEDEKKKKLEDEKRLQQNRYDEDFQQVIRKELELHGYQNTQPNKNFDYLTNPGGVPQEDEQPIQQQPTNIQPEPYNIAEGLEKLQRFYENSLKKKFERRQVMPHKACRRRTPKLYITQKTNALSKHGKPLSQQQHKFRVLTKQTTPQQIYPVIPNFAVVKDNLSKNIVAYLGDYKPFIQKTKEKVEKQLKKTEQEIIVQNSNKSVTITN